MGGANKLVNVFIKGELKISEIQSRLNLTLIQCHFTLYLTKIYTKQQTYWERENVVDYLLFYKILITGQTFELIHNSVSSFLIYTIHMNICPQLLCGTL